MFRIGCRFAHPCCRARSPPGRGQHQVGPRCCCGRPGTATRPSLMMSGRQQGGPRCSRPRRPRQQQGGPCCSRHPGRQAGKRNHRPHAEATGRASPKPPPPGLAERVTPLTHFGARSADSPGCGGATAARWAILLFGHRPQQQQVGHVALGTAAERATLLPAPGWSQQQAGHVGLGRSALAAPEPVTVPGSWRVVSGCDGGVGGG